MRCWQLGAGTREVMQPCSHGLACAGRVEQSRTGLSSTGKFQPSLLQHAKAYDAWASRTWWLPRTALAS